MPQRTNDFQRLIKTIYEQIVPEGATVTESGLVFDKDAETLREVDILVEYKYAGHQFRFIVECRDRSRPATVEWIDSLVGKANSLDVNKVIAVSSRGFAKAAIEKASKNGIEALSLKEATEADWKRFYIKPGITVVSDDNLKLEDVLYVRDSDYHSVAELGWDSAVEIDGVTAGELLEFIQYTFYEHVVPEINVYKKDHFSELFKTRADIDKPLLVELNYEWPGIIVLTASGRRIEFRNVRFVVTGRRHAVDLNPAHSVFNEMLVSTASHNDSDGSVIAFNIVQDPEARKLYTRWSRTGPIAST
jgi:hypothetical protein